jgi:transcriptional regulator with XRE-family HTH domain
MISKILKYLRKTNNISQKEIADFIEISRSNYSLYESGKRIPPIDKLEKLAEFYSVSTDYLLGRTNDPTPVRNLNEDLYSEDPDEELRQLLSDPEMRVAFKNFPNWSNGDKQELINYLKAKQMVRDSNDKE